ncbi:MAG: hypothetical protein QTN59_01040 [Candidatus Electrothrix communis]|nr:MAG: hypothetical protein QTN59_01040 [Candidatus Electrothrix communis]
MKKFSTFLSLVIAATILSGCYVSPYAYNHYRGGYGSQCPPPIKVDVEIKKKKEEKKKPDCKPVCKPTCEPTCKPVCPFH